MKKIIIALLLFCNIALADGILLGSIVTAPNPKAAGFSTGTYTNSTGSIFGTSILGVNQAIVSNSCVGVADGICLSYTTGTGTFGVGAADAINFSVNGVANSSIDQFGRIRSAIIDAAPTITAGACGAAANGTIPSGNSQNFRLSVGAAATTICTINFTNAWTTAPNACAFFALNAAAAASATTAMYQSAISTASVTFTGVALANTLWGVQCQ